MNSVRNSVLVLVALGLLFASSAAEAKDVAGRFGLGLDNTMTAATLAGGAIPASPNSLNAPTLGLSLKYWIDNDWAIAGVLGFLYATGEATQNVYNDDGGIWAFSLDFKGIYNFVKGDKANLGAFATLHMRKESVTLKRPEGPYHSDFGFAFALGFTPEVFLTDDFALNVEFGLNLRFQQGVAFGISGDNLLGGFGFHYYF
ncbi:MAG: hypothetical protein C4523_03965 [Myxococcales bacterium]|nr:MAG: hypothetical protein C4523_03965 [Myxococcales bacterium]